MARKKYIEEVKLKLDGMEVEPESKKIMVSTQYPQTVDGWVKKLGKMGWGLDEIACLRALIASGMAEEAMNKYERKKDNIPFETVWNLYNYRVGSKIRAEQRWRRLSVSTQEKVLTAIVKYNRFCQVTGVNKQHLATYLSPGTQGYNMEIPGPEKWQKWREVLKVYAAKIDVKRRNPSYLASDETIDLALEALMYRYPDVHITQAMGILRWMNAVWDRKFWHLITIQTACNVNKFSERVILAQAHIDIVRNAMQTKTDKLFAYNPDNVTQRIIDKLTAEAKSQETEEE